jgi:hypothetical protein
MTAHDDRSAYLWDGSGEPDEDVQHLERVLGSLRHHAPLLPLSERAPGSTRVAPARWMNRLIMPLTAAAVLALVVSAVWLSESQRRAGWEVANLAGAPRVAANPIGAQGHIRVGEWLETDARSRARITVGQIGQVVVDPNTRIGLLEARVTENRLSLERGTIHAAIGAPPGVFAVVTPSAVAVDLGCAYTLHVDDEGAGLLVVTEGWVAFEFEGRESFIPKGAICATRPGFGPGTPRFEDAPAPIGPALEQLDFGALNPAQRSAAVAVVLEQARHKDAVTLWHLLSRTGGADRERVYERLASLVPPPTDVTRAGILRGNHRMLDLWWDALGLEKTDWWRMWKMPWTKTK